MTTILDEPLEADVPRAHALVIGVSHYPHADLPPAEQGDAISPVAAFARSAGIESLTSAARSASMFADWLLNDFRIPDTKLASLELLLSPVAGEEPSENTKQRLRNLDPESWAATRRNAEAALVRLRARCTNRPNDVLIVYLAGHGVQLSKYGAVLLLEDFGDPTHLNELQGAIDAESCRRGFDSTDQPGTQFWFVDACRSKPPVLKKFETMTGALELSTLPGQVETSAMILATLSASSAYGVIGGTSLLNTALLEGLDGSAAVGPDDDCNEWWVGTPGLLSHLKDRVRELAISHAVEQHVDIAGRPAQAILHRFETPPQAELTVHVSPEAAEADAVVDVLFDGLDPVVRGEAAPLTRRLPSGLYSISVTVDEPPQTGAGLVSLSPPKGQRVVEVGP